MIVIKAMPFGPGKTKIVLVATEHPSLGVNIDGPRHRDDVHFIPRQSLDTGTDICLLKNISSDVVNVVLCALHGHFTNTERTVDPGYEIEEARTASVESQACEFHEEPSDAAEAIIKAFTSPVNEATYPPSSFSTLLHPHTPLPSQTRCA